MDEFFEDNQPVTTQHVNQSKQEQYDNNNNNFNYQSSDPSPIYNQFNSSPSQQNIGFEQDQNIKRMKEQQSKIQQKLREKAQIQYQQKQKRKQRGRVQLEEFLQRKDQQKQQRKQSNLKTEEQTKQNNKKLENKSCWKKVAANIKIKQGQYVGMKDVNRMRQVIINKKNDQQ